jgi:hypothetical protein
MATRNTCGGIYFAATRSLPRVAASVEQLPRPSHYGRGFDRAGGQGCRQELGHGTHQGEYMGIEPTGKSVTYNEIFIFRFVNGRIAETWGSSTSSRRCDSSAPFVEASHHHTNGGVLAACSMPI